MSRPQGWSKWTHRENGGQYTVLTIAKLEGGLAPDEYVYGLKLDPAKGVFDAFVMQIDDWEDAMIPLSDAKCSEDDLDDLI